MKQLSVPMNRAETVLGIIYILIQLFVLPVIVSIVDLVFVLSLTDAEINFVCFAVNFICVTVIFRRYLISNFRVMLQDPAMTAAGCGLGFVLYFAATYMIGLLILSLDPDFANANDTSIAVMMDENSVLMSVGAVLLAPVIEELLYRGVVFGQLYRRWPIIAYIVSAAFFASLHVVGYIGSYAPMRLVLCFIQYLPASVVLAWVYVYTDTIFAPIMIHVIINAMGILTLR